MKFKKIISLFLVTIVLNFFCGITVFASSPSEKSSTVQDSTKRYIVKFRTSGINGGKLISKYKGSFKHQFNHFNVATANLSVQNLSNLKKDPNVAYVEEDSIVKISDTKVSPIKVITKASSESTIKALTNWGVNDIKAPASWQAGLTGNGVKIAVIDTGAGPHPNLIVAGGTNVINGSNTTSYADDNGHGTHVAGIIAAQGLNGDVKGVAPGASIYAIKALDSTGSGYASDIISGIEWAIDNNMNIITESFGSSQSDMALQDAVNTAYNDGLLVVAAVGNDGNTAGTGTNIEYPANYYSVIAVGAVDSTNTRAYFSSTGNKVEVSAPGVDITSTYLNGGYAQMSGTSMAAPFVAADLALLKQKYPSATNVELRQLLDNNVVDLGVQGRDPLYGYGLIVAPNTSAANTRTPVGVQYQAHVQTIGWQSPVSDEQEAGTDGKSLRVEALKINLVNAPVGAKIKYQAHIQNIGWQNWLYDGQEAGTDGKSLRIEAFRLKLENMPGYSIQYQAHVQNIGWQNWVSDGQEAGTDGKSLRIEALKIKIVKISDNATMGVQYQGHVQNIGWQDTVENGQISGTEGKSLRVEALKMNLLNAPTGAKIQYQAHVQNVGWQNWVSDGQEAGTDGKSLRVEAIKIQLVNMPGYSVQYRAHVQNIGWQNWVNDGQEAGTDGKGLRVEAIEIRIISLN